MFLSRSLSHKTLTTVIRSSGEVIMMPTRAGSYVPSTTLGESVEGKKKWKNIVGFENWELQRGAQSVFPGQVYDQESVTLVCIIMTNVFITQGYMVSYWCQI